MTNKTPGLFKYSNQDDVIGTIVLDAVIGSELEQPPGAPAVLSVGLTGGAIMLDKQVDIDAFGAALAEHQAAKHAQFAQFEGPEGRLYSATARDGVFTASATGASAVGAGDRAHVEAESADEMMNLLRAIGLMREGSDPALHVHKIDLAGVDLSDPEAVRKAAEAAGQAIKAILAEDGKSPPCVCGNNLPSPHAAALLGDLRIAHESNAWIREKVDEGMRAQAVQTPYAHPETMGDFIFHLAYQAEEAAKLRRNLDKAALDCHAQEQEVLALRKRIDVVVKECAEAMSKLGSSLADRIVERASYRDKLNSALRALNDPPATRPDHDTGL